MIAALLLCSVLAAPDCQLWTASWCGACRDVVQSSHALRKEGWQIEERDFDQHRAEAGQRGIRLVPQFILIEKDRITARLEGAQTKDRIRDWLKEHGVRQLHQVPDKTPNRKPHDEPQIPENQ